MTYYATLTPEMRLRALAFYFDTSNTTASQFAEMTGLNVDVLLYGKDSGAKLSGGFSAVRTCDAPWRCGILAPKHLGDVDYWRDVIIGFWVTGPLESVK